MVLKLKESDYKSIIDYCEKNYPKESCGILAGKNSIVEKIYFMKNVSDTPQTCYFMEPKEQINVMKEIRENGMELVGIFHSHIDVKAYLSKKDIELAFYPDAFYVVISIIDGKFNQMNAFKISEKSITQEDIEIF